AARADPAKNPRGPPRPPAGPIPADAARRIGARVEQARRDEEADQSLPHLAVQCYCNIDWRNSGRGNESRKGRNGTPRATVQSSRKRLEPRVEDAAESRGLAAADRRGIRDG